MGSSVVGLVGCGRWGTLIRDRLRALGATVVVVDPAGGAGVLHTIEELPAVDGIVVATPATTHTQVLEAVAALGVPIFCEKPLTTDPAEADRLAAELGDQLHVMHIWHYHRGVHALADIAQSGELGAPQVLRSTRANWTSPRTDTDAAWTLLPHDITLAIAILGHIPQPRSAIADVVDGNIAAIWALCQNDEGPALVIEASTRHEHKQREIRLHCADGVAILPDVDSDHVILLRGRDPEPEREQRPLPPGEPMLDQLQSFLSHLAGGPAPLSTASEGAEVVHAVATLRRLAGH